jgi:hypothetical protein
MSQLEKLIAKFDDAPLETEFPVFELMAPLGIGPALSRRLQEVRAHYLPLGFLVLNRTERHPDATHSFYRKVRASDYPDEYADATAKAERDTSPHVAERQQKSTRIVHSFSTTPPKSWDEVCAERDRKLSAEPPVLVLTP